MTKKNNNRENRFSPENYIRQRSRNLPIYQCWLNHGWEEQGTASIIIIRKHVSGNVTFCMYMVDLFCRGVVDTFYRYNEPEEVLQRLRKDVDEKNYITFEDVSYNLVHNIIFAGLEYADEYGFKPVADFTYVTQYFLEEDDDKIPLIDIHCGDDDGKPLYINTGSNSPAKEKQILDHLEKTAGKGNYHYILGTDFRRDDDYDDEEDEDYDYDDEEDDDEDELKELRDTFCCLELEDLKSRFLELLYESNLDDHVPAKNIKYLYAITDVIIGKIVDLDKAKDYLNIVKADLDIEVIDMFDIPNSLFSGLVFDGDADQLENIYNDIFDIIMEEDKETIALEKFRKELGDIPLLYYLELTIIDHSDAEYERKLDEYYHKYPDYLLFQILQYARSDNKEDLKTLLSKRTEPITAREMSEFLNSYIEMYMLDDPVPEKLVTMEAIVKYFEKEFDIIVYLSLLYITVAKIDVAKKIFGYDEWLKNKENV